MHMNKLACCYLMSCAMLSEACYPQPERGVPNTGIKDMRGFRGGGGPNPHPLENLKAIGFLWSTVPEPLGNHKATKPASNVGPSSARQRRVRGCCPTFSCILGFLMLVGGLDGE